VTLRENADTVVIKRGPAGALVFCRGYTTPKIIPAFRTDAVFKIGSGDVFSAMFAHYWSTRGRDAATAAELASRQVADYVQTRILPRPAVLPQLEEVAGAPSKLRVLLAADVETTPALWLAEEARAALLNLGVAEVKSSNAFGILLPKEIFTTCDVVLVLPRTETGLAALTAAAAVNFGIPCIGFAETIETSRALRQAGALVIGDFAASIYSVIWSAS
jgi:hypothetical protein